MDNKLGWVPNPLAIPLSICKNPNIASHVCGKISCNNTECLCDEWTELQCHVPVVVGCDLKFKLNSTPIGAIQNHFDQNKNRTHRQLSQPHASMRKIRMRNERIRNTKTMPLQGRHSTPNCQEVPEGLSASSTRNVGGWRLGAKIETFN